MSNKRVRTPKLKAKHIEKYGEKGARELWESKRLARKYALYPLWFAYSLLGINLLTSTPFDTTWIEITAYILVLPITMAWPGFVIYWVIRFFTIPEAVCNYYGLKPSKDDDFNQPSFLANMSISTSDDLSPTSDLMCNPCFSHLPGNIRYSSS